MNECGPGLSFSSLKFSNAPYVWPLFQSLAQGVVTLWIRDHTFVGPRIHSANAYTNKRLTYRKTFTRI